MPSILCFLLQFLHAYLFSYTSPILVVRSFSIREKMSEDRLHLPFMHICMRLLLQANEAYFISSFFSLSLSPLFHFLPEIMVKHLGE